MKKLKLFSVALLIGALNVCAHAEGVANSPIYIAPNRAFSAEIPFSNPSIQDSVGDSQVTQFVDFYANKGYLMEGFESIDWIPVSKFTNGRPFINKSKDIKALSALLKHKEEVGQIFPVNNQASPQCKSLLVNERQAYQCSELVWVMSPQAQFTLIATMINFDDHVVFIYGNNANHARFINSIQKL